ncbi:Sulfite exporter TauE/SafE family protein isoform 1 [Tripterygium wilfordii]|uniref:Sulfite exporter TauE/SafE family protein isoform 1 n=1 Tax=Tripterygium wilfordii TaxID=458696 RepID=A0A7J7DNR9_TRIWF|nr:sulfite exporter TauE/SafE family protein 4-like [Tripterygium wilfordii]KAF5747844.1 Sulfite exporter TauE/SafE family protein isoform 1 [Tripterygium wilfordii]
MSTRGFVLYLLSGFSVAVLSVLFVTDKSYSNQKVFLSSNGSRSGKDWPKLEFNGRLVAATVIGFLGSACGTVGGVGGGAIFVPMLTLIVGFDTKSAAALSKCMIMGASASSVWYNLRVPHPSRNVPILDYDLALLFQPVLMLGISVGVSLSVVFPYWLITVLIIILFLGTSSRSFFKAVEMWKDETIMKKELANQQVTTVNSRGELLIDTEYEPLVPREERSKLQILCFNLRWKRLLVLLVVWLSFLLLQIIKNYVAVCSTWYWVLFCLQFPITLGVFGYEAIKLYKDHNKRISTGNTESICEASIAWTPLHLAFCALCGLLGGTVGGLLGSGGGFILGPLLLEIGVIPQVASATATFVMLYSSSLSVVEFYLLKRFPVPFALYLMTVSVVAGFWGQFFVRKLITILRRASLIVFILSGVIFVGAITMGVIGVEKSIDMIHKHEFMGFLGFCSSQ